LARALVVEPSVLLLDEPLSNLDAKLREAMRSEIRALVRRLGVTTVLVTHDQDEALAMADRVAVMRDGRVEQYGTPDEVYGSPSNRFVADFVGRANLLRGNVVEAGVGRVGIRVAGLGQVAANSRSHLSPGEDVYVLIRPQLVHLGDPPADSASVVQSWSGVVADSSFTGEMIGHTVSIGGVNLTTEAIAGPFRRRAVGDNVTVWWSSSDALVLPGDSTDAA
jgi:ABC-type Fe3+/spermidine/putrescine transport system ATPase subunit